MLHCIAGDQRASSSQTGLAMNSNTTLLSFDHIEELVHDFEAGSCSVSEKHIFVFDTIFGKTRSFICFVVESDNHGNSQLLKNGNVVLGAE